MTDKEFAEQVYRGLTMIAGGLGVLVAAWARRYALGQRRDAPAPLLDK